MVTATAVASGIDEENYAVDESDLRSTLFDCIINESTETYFTKNIVLSLKMGREKNANDHCFSSRNE